MKWLNNLLNFFQTEQGDTALYETFSNDAPYIPLALPIKTNASTSDILSALTNFTRGSKKCTTTQPGPCQTGANISLADSIITSSAAVASEMETASTEETHDVDEISSKSTLLTKSTLQSGSKSVFTAVLNAVTGRSFDKLQFDKITNNSGITLNPNARIPSLLQTHALTKINNLNNAAIVSTIVSSSTLVGMQPIVQMGSVISYISRGLRFYFSNMIGPGTGTSIMTNLIRSGSIVNSSPYFNCFLQNLGLSCAMSERFSYTIPAITVETITAPFTIVKTQIYKTNETGFNKNLELYARLFSTPKGLQLLANTILIGSIKSGIFWTGLPGMIRYGQTKFISDKDPSLNVAFKTIGISAAAGTSISMLSYPLHVIQTKSIDQEISPYRVVANLMQGHESLTRIIPEFYKGATINAPKMALWAVVFNFGGKIAVWSYKMLEPILSAEASPSTQSQSSMFL